MQVQQRQDLGHLGAATAPGRQDHRAEPRPLAGRRVDAAVVDPRCAHWDRSGHGGNLTLAGVAVADHQPPAALVPLGGEGGQGGVDLGLQGGGQHPPGTLTGQAVQVGVQLRLCGLVSDYTQHRGVTLLTGVAAPVSHLGWSSRRVRRALAQEADPQLQVIPQPSGGHLPNRIALSRRARPNHYLRPLDSPRFATEPGFRLVSDGDFAGWVVLAHHEQQLVLGDGYLKPVDAPLESWSALQFTDSPVRLNDPRPSQALRCHVVAAKRRFAAVTAGRDGLGPGLSPLRGSLELPAFAAGGVPRGEVVRLAGYRKPSSRQAAADWTAAMASDYLLG